MIATLETAFKMRNLTHNNQNIFSKIEILFFNFKKRLRRPPTLPTLLVVPLCFVFIKLIFFSRICCNVQIFWTKKNELGKPTSKTEINSKILPRIVSNFLKKAVVWVSFTQPEELLRVISWKNIQGVSEQTFKNWNLFQRNHFSTLDSRIFPKSKELQCILINNRNAQVTSQLYWRMKKKLF